MLKNYRATKTGDGGTVEVSSDGKMWRSISPRHDLANHSPTGLSWGYGGSGPAQTALAILADYTQDDALALALYQEFKWDWIASQPFGGFTIAGDQIRDWLHKAKMETV